MRLPPSTLLGASSRIERSLAGLSDESSARSEFDDRRCYHQGMTTNEPDPPEDTGVVSVKISTATKLVLDRLDARLRTSSLGELVAFLAEHFESSGHLSRFVDLRELCALGDRLQTVLLFLATTNLELAQHLRRIHSGHYRRLAQYGDELVALHNRLLARSRLAANDSSHHA